MGIVQLAAVIESAICLAVLMILLFNLWPAYRVDAFRQQLFAVRDEMFDYAASGKIAFNDPAYRLLRQLMNGFIRYAHQLTFFRVCLTVVSFWALREELDRTWSTKWELALDNIRDEKAKADLKNFHSRTSELAATRLVSGSPVFVAILVFFVVGLVLQEGWKNLKDLLTEATAAAVSRVIDPRSLEEEAARIGA